ncbi:MAG: glycosyltransferase family 39 protein [Ilumatobacteraceae bacterium]
MGPERRRTAGWIAAAVAISVALRAPMMFTPLNADEGGYLAIARAWAHGRVLYRDVWVDRPQGLLSLFRAWNWIAGGHTSSIRVLAMLFGALLVMSTAVVAWRLFGQRAARWTAVTCAVVSSAPMLEGYIPNGELLSGAVATTGLAVAVVGVGRHHEWRWMLGAGLLAGTALSLKQSGFDALVAMLLWLAITAVADPARRRWAMRAGVWLIAGCTIVLTVLVVDAAFTGWQRWWFAVGGYRSTTMSLFSDPRWPMLRRTARYGALVLGPALLVGVLGVAGRAVHRSPDTRQRWPRRDLLVLLWLAAATWAFLLGGGYWRHYWLLLAAPISTLAGAAIADTRRIRLAVPALTVVPAVVASIWVFTGSSGDLPARAASDHQAVIDHNVANWYKTHRRAGDSLYVLCGGPAVYADTDEDPPVPYLWFPEVIVGPGATEHLIAYLDRTPPTYIAQYAAADTCDPTGQVKALLDQHYRGHTTVDGVTILSRVQPVDAEPSAQ